MAEIINFNKVRKARDKAQAKAEAGVKRAAFGRGKADKAREAAEREAAARLLDGAKRDDD